MSLTQKNLPYKHWELLDDKTGNRIRVVPERGGLVTEWRSNGREILYFDFDRFQDLNKSIRGGIPLLFPICGGLSTDNSCSSYQLKQHGFARDLPWKVIDSKEENKFALSLTANLETMDVYPYSFYIELKLSLEKNALDIQIVVHNRGKESMPFSFGLHPYFNISDFSAIKVHGLGSHAINQPDQSQIKTSDALSRLSRGVDFITGPSTLVSLVDKIAQTKLIIEHQLPMDLTVIWTDPSRKMICIEPWTSPRDALITGERKLLIEPDAFNQLGCRLLSSN